MKTVFRSNREVVEAWASGKYPEGRAGNIFFVLDKIYSYGRHFCIARRLAATDSTVLTTRSYSPTTHRHIALVRRIVPNEQLVYAHDPDATLITNYTQVLRTVTALLDEARDRPGIREVTRARLEEQARETAREFNRYRMAMLAWAPAMKPADTPCFNLEIINRDTWVAHRALHQD